MMTRQEIEDAIKVAQVTYLLEGGDKERMQTRIPTAWGRLLPKRRDYVWDERLTAPKVEAAPRGYSEFSSILKDLYRPAIKAHLEDSTTLHKLWDKQK